jgi:hypothetical protein
MVAAMSPESPRESGPAEADDLDDEVRPAIAAFVTRAPAARRA